MDFLFGSQSIDKTTCLIHLANKFIVDKDLKPSNGYILLFTPSSLSNPSMKEKKQIKKGYNFVQHFTEYSHHFKKNLDLIKCYTLSSFDKSCDLINNFRLISRENRGLKLILIDDITSIISLWTTEIINQRKNRAKKEERTIIESNLNTTLIFHQIFQYFLTQISLLQKSYKIHCFIAIDLDPFDKIYFSKNASRIFNAIFPFVRSSFFFQKSEENQIDFEENKLALNKKTNKIELSEYKQNQQVFEFDGKPLGDLNDDEENKIENKNENFSVNKEWLKHTIGDFVENFNDYIIKKLTKEKEENEDKEMSSLTQTIK